MSDSNDRSVAERLRNALSKGLLGIVVDNGLEDVQSIEKGLVDLGLAGLVERWNRGSITVFYINVKRLRAACLYEKCSTTPRSEVESCIAKCIQEKIHSLKDRLGELGGSL
jgi:hypothetical protein